MRSFFRSLADQMQTGNDDRHDDQIDDAGCDHIRCVVGDRTPQRSFPYEDTTDRMTQKTQEVGRQHAGIEITDSSETGRRCHRSRTQTDSRRRSPAGLRCTSVRSQTGSERKPDRRRPPSSIPDDSWRPAARSSRYRCCRLAGICRKGMNSLEIMSSTANNAAYNAIKTRSLTFEFIKKHLHQ